MGKEWGFRAKSQKNSFYRDDLCEAVMDDSFPVIMTMTQVEIRREVFDDGVP